MNHLDVQIIGVLPDKDSEAFCYTVDAPTNLWIGALCEDGSRMGNNFMAFVLNELIEADCFNKGDTVEVSNQDGVLLTATVGQLVPARQVEAFAAKGPGRWPTVRIVTVAVAP